MFRLHRYHGTAVGIAILLLGGSLHAQSPAVAPLPDLEEYLKNAQLAPTGFDRPRPMTVSPIIPCLPCVPCSPCGPRTVIPGAPSTPSTPSSPSQQPLIDPGALATSTQTAANLGGFDSGVGTPSTIGMFGNYFGGRPNLGPAFVKRPGLLNGYTIVASVNPLYPGGNGVIGNFANAAFSLRDPTGRFPISNQTIPFSLLGIVGSFTETIPTPRITPPILTGTLQYLGGEPGATIPAGLNLTPANQQRLTAARNSRLLPNLIQAPDLAKHPNAQPGPVSFDPVTAAYVDNDYTGLEYVSRINSYYYLQQTITVPNPSAGGVVGLITIAEDNSPLPRDRFIFNYDYFDQVPFTPTGIPVNRYQFGFEKTFFDGWTSLEVRLPFASTLNSTIGTFSDGTNTEFGNLRLAVKALLLRRPTLNIATGLAIYLPTADSIQIIGPDGSDLIRVDNSSVQLSPYIGALLTPNERLFAQAWIGFVFDTKGNPVHVNPEFFAGSYDIGNLRAGTLMMVDLQIGYWLYQADSGILQRLAPFCELHYNGTVSNGSVLSTSSGLLIGDVNGNFDDWTLSAGFLSQLGQNTTLSVGAVAPLRSGQNRMFDYQVGVRLNYFFGYTARQRAAASRVTGF